MVKHNPQKPPLADGIKTIGGKQYVVRSFYGSEEDIKTSILKLAERKAMREMGLDIPVKSTILNSAI